MEYIFSGVGLGSADWKIFQVEKQTKKGYFKKMDKYLKQGYKELGSYREEKLRVILRISLFYT